MSSNEHSYTLSSEVQDELGDIAVTCLPQAQSQPRILFKLQKRNLEVYSSVFADMLASSEASDTWEKLPIVHLVEKAETMSTIFAIICKIADHPSVKRFDDWNQVCDIWTTASKYDMQAILLLARSSMK